jgi:hypothetical protein
LPWTQAIAADKEQNAFLGTAARHRHRRPRQHRCPDTRAGPKTVLDHAFRPVPALPLAEHARDCRGSEQEPAGRNCALVRPQGSP